MERITLEQMCSLKGTVALVTGAVGSIGREVSMHLAGAGADSVIVDLNMEPMEPFAKELAECYGVRTLAVRCDVTDAQDVENCVKEAGEKMGTLDILFNNAVIGMHKSCLEVSEQDWKKINDVNYNGVFYMATAFARFLISQNKGGSIINTASMSGVVVNVPQEQIAYNSSKAGVIQMTHSLAMELAKYGIRVNSISPGYMASAMTAKRPQELRDYWCARIPMGRMGTPKEISTGVLYLAADSASYTTGCNLIMDGGYTII